MKKYIIIGAVLISGMIFAQNTSVKPELEAVGNKVKATYLYENGQVQQQGFYKNGKLQSIGGDGLVMFVRFAKEGLPKIETVNMYGASSRPGNKHFDDQVVKCTEVDRVVGYRK